MAVADAAQVCRLCGGALEPRFERTVLGKYGVTYHRCSECQSLQTDRPYWLGESYSSNLSPLDTGVCQRNLDNAALCLFLSRLFGLQNVVDFGGGDGLLCRLLRDYGLNCFVSDKYASPVYAQGFSIPDFETPDLALAFEVVEHFVEPMKDWDALFARRPRLLLVSTGIYSGQSADWWYLAPEIGQHVFFYGESALRLIARRFDYELVRLGDYMVFARHGEIGYLRRIALRVFFSNRARRGLKAIAAFTRTPGTWRDHVEIRSRLGRGSEPR